MSQFDGNRLAIKMENIEDVHESGHLLVDIMPEEEITIYSLPKHIDSELSEKASIRALEELTKVQKRINNSYSSKYSYFCAYLSDLASITIIRKDMSMQKGKYRGDSKFSNAFKAKKVRRNEVILETIKI